MFKSFSIISLNAWGNVPIFLTRFIFNYNQLKTIVQDEMKNYKSQKSNYTPEQQYIIKNKDYQSLASLASVIHETTLCGLGQTSPTSIISTMEFFNDEYIERIKNSKEVQHG